MSRRNSRYSALPSLEAKFVQKWKQALEDPRKRSQLERLLAKTLIFAGTNEAFRSAIVDAVQPIEYHMGQVIFRHGEPGDWMGLVLSGRLERRLQRRDNEIVIGSVAPGGVIGDLGLFGVNPHRSFTVITVEQTVLLVLSRAQFERCMSEQDRACEILTAFRNGTHMENLMKDVESFLNLQCFRKMDKDFVMTLRDHSEPRLCYPNQIIMKEGSYGNEMFILRAGKVKIEKGGKFVVELHSGVVLGELAVLGSDKRRTATVTCTSLCLVRVLHGDVFHDILDSFPRAKRVFDHAYIARLVSIEMQSASEDLKKLDSFYGSASPRTDAQMVSLFGDQLKIDPRSGLQSARGTSKQLALPKINKSTTREGLPTLTPRRKNSKKYMSNDNFASKDFLSIGAAEPENPEPDPLKIMTDPFLIKKAPLGPDPIFNGDSGLDSSNLID